MKYLAQINSAGQCIGASGTAYQGVVIQLDPLDTLIEITAEEFKTAVGKILVDGVLVEPPVPPAPPQPEAPPPPVPLPRATKRAFQNRFPKTTDGMSTKYDAVTLFLIDDGYAALIGVSGVAMYSLRMLIMAGKNRLDASPFVNLSPNSDGSPTEAEAFTLLLTQPTIPAELRLTAADRTAMLDTPLADAERYTG